MDFELLRLVDPFEDESLAGYLTRLAKANYCPIEWIVHELNKYKFERISIPQFLNFIYSDKLITALAQISNLSNERIIDLTIYKYCKNPWFLDLFVLNPANNDGIYGYVSFKTKYCPLCLEEKQYHRLYWHLDHVLICLKHKVYLLYKCFYCGKELSPIEISLGECRCGMSLVDVPTHSVGDEILIRNQLRVFEIYEINESIKADFMSEKSYLNLDKSEYIKLIRLLIFFVQIANVNNTYLDCMVKVEKALDEWPNNYILILNELFELYLLNKLDIRKYDTDFCFYAKKPKREIRIPNTLVERIGFFSKKFYRILNNFYSSEYIKKRFEHILNNGKLIDLEHVNSCFLFDTISIKLLFNVIKDNRNKEYVYFDEVMNFFKALIDNKINECFKDSYTQITEIYKYSKVYLKDLTMFDILDVIKREGIGYFISPFYFGLDMIFAPADRVIGELRQLKKRNGYLPSNLKQGIAQNLHF